MYVYNCACRDHRKGSYVLPYHSSFSNCAILLVTLHVIEELFSARNGILHFTEFDGLDPWIQKGYCIQDNDGLHDISLSRVYGNLMSSATKSMEKYGGEYFWKVP